MFGELNNAASLLLPTLNRAGAMNDQQGKGAWPKASADNKAPDPVGDVEQPTTAFDFRRRFDKDRSVQVLTGHPLPHSLKYTEQSEGGPQNLNRSNTLTFDRWHGNDEPPSFIDQRSRLGQP